MEPRKPIAGPKSATAQGAFWSAAAQDWAGIQESAALALYDAVIAETGLGAGTELLDVGCGAGRFCALAAQSGAAVAGIDAAPAQIAIAQERVSDGDFTVGAMENLPYADDSYDVVTVLNSLHYSAEPVTVLREVSRVGRSGAPIVIGTWDTPADSEAAVYIQALRQFIPADEPGAAVVGPLSMSEPGIVEALLERAGLEGGPWHNVECPFIYRDRDEALRGLLSSGPAAQAIERAGRENVERAIADTIEPFKNAFGGYRMENTFRYRLATAP